MGFQETDVGRGFHWSIGGLPCSRCGLRPVFPTSTRRPFEQITETYHIANVNRFLFNEGFAPANDTLYSNSLEGDFGRFGSLVTYW